MRTLRGILKKKKKESKIDRSSFEGANVSWKDAAEGTLLLQPDFSFMPFLKTVSVPMHRTSHISNITRGQLVLSFESNRTMQRTTVHERNSNREERTVSSPPPRIVAFV